MVLVLGNNNSSDLVLTVSLLCIWRSKWSEMRHTHCTYAIKSFYTPSNGLDMCLHHYTTVEIRTVCDPEIKSNKSVSDVHYVQTALFYLQSSFTTHRQSLIKTSKKKDVSWVWYNKAADPVLKVKFEEKTNMIQLIWALQKSRNMFESICEGLLAFKRNETRTETQTWAV